MPSYPEIKSNAREVRRRIKQDQNNPYRVRRRKKGGKDSRGQTNDADQYEYRTMDNMLTQPLSRTAADRLEEGLRIRKPRFVAVVPKGTLFSDKDEMLDEFEQVEYLGEWYEVHGINNWDLVMHAHMVTVE